MQELQIWTKTVALKSCNQPLKEEQTTYPNPSVPVGLRDADVRVPLDHRRLRLPQAGQVLHVIVHVLDRERQDLDAHPPDVGRRHLANQTRELISVLVHLFDCKRSCLTNRRVYFSNGMKLFCTIRVQTPSYEIIFA